MGKKRERSETEYLKGLIRELKSQNRHLKKQVGRAAKREHLSEEHECDDEPAELEQQRAPMCPDCGKHSLSMVSLGVRTLFTCKECGYRRSQK